MAGGGSLTFGFYALLLVGIVFVHASYQLSVSVLTHMSSHSLSRRVGTERLLNLGLNYSLGAILTTALVLVTVVSLATGSTGTHRMLGVEYLEVIVSGLAPIVGLVTLLFYFRNERGTQLWLPRPIANYLLERSRKTRSATEAFFLGAATVVGELPFLIAPILLIAVVLGTLTPTSWFGWSLLYSLVVSLPLLFVTFFISSGHSIARIQRWREQNKQFLQITSGVALIILTLLITLLQIGVLA